MFIARRSHEGFHKSRLACLLHTESRVAVGTCADRSLLCEAQRRLGRSQHRSRAGGMFRAMKPGETQNAWSTYPRTTSTIDIAIIPGLLEDSQWRALM